MYPEIFAPVAASNDVTDLIGSAPVRFFQFGQAPQNVAKPYAVWRTVYGNPENYLSDIPDVDRWGVQVDTYAHTPDQARSVAEAIRAALEPSPGCYLVGYDGESIDPNTKNRTVTMTYEFMQRRPIVSS